MEIGGKKKHIMVGPPDIENDKNKECLAGLQNLTDFENLLNFYPNDLLKWWYWISDMPGGQWRLTFLEIIYSYSLQPWHAIIKLRCERLWGFERGRQSMKRLESSNPRFPQRARWTILETSFLASRSVWIPWDCWAALEFSPPILVNAPLEYEAGRQGKPTSHGDHNQESVVTEYWHNGRSATCQKIIINFKHLP